MKPLIFQYTEKSSLENHDFSQIEYNEALNLSIDKNSLKPAVSFLNIGTETFTRTFNEESDSDNNRMAVLMGTVTQTLYHVEGSDDDNGYGRRFFH